MRKRVRPTSFTYGAADAIVMGPNPKRTALIISSSSAQPVSIAFGESSVTNPLVTLRVNTEPLILTRDLIGDDITLPVRGSAGGATTAPISEVYTE